MMFAGKSKNKEPILSRVGSSVRLAVLGLLLEREYHGYDLKKSIDRRMGMWTDIRFGSIFYALAKLEKNGFICKVHTEKRNGKPRRYIYSITQSGQTEFQRLLRENLITFQPIHVPEDISIYFGERLESEMFKLLVSRHLELLKNRINELIDHRSRMEGYALERINVSYWLITHHIMHFEADLEWFQQILEEQTAGKLYPAARPLEQLKSSFPVSEIDNIK